AVAGLADDRMADRTTAAINVETPDSGEEIVGDDLIVAAVLIITVGDVKKTVGGMKEHAATVVPDAIAGLIDENGFGTRDGDAGRVERETRESIMISASIECGRA